MCQNSHLRGKICEKERESVRRFSLHILLGRIFRACDAGPKNDIKYFMTCGKAGQLPPKIYQRLSFFGLCTARKKYNLSRASRDRQTAGDMVCRTNLPELTSAYDQSVLLSQIIPQGNTTRRQ